jgi:hypothetical protein
MVCHGTSRGCDVIHGGLRDRAILVPVEVVGLLIPLAIMAAWQLAFGGAWAFVAAAAILSSVRREIFRYAPVMAGMFGMGLVVSGVLSWIGG